MYQIGAGLRAKVPSMGFLRVGTSEAGWVSACAGRPDQSAGWGRGRELYGIAWWGGCALCLDTSEGARRP